MTAATPTKLRDGSWGARVQGSVHQGDLVQITTKSGKSWTAIVQRVVWSGEGVAIVATESTDRPARSNGRRSRQDMIDADEMCYRGHRNPVPGCRDCFDTFDC